MTTWKNRIIGEGAEQPDQILANPKNWRVHPQSQQTALTSILDRVGWVQQVIINRRTGNLVDGHLRVTLAMRKGEPEIPVVYVDISEEEEDLILATLDPLAGLATADRDLLKSLMQDIEFDDENVANMLNEIIGDEAETQPPDTSIDDEEPPEDSYKEQYGVIIICLDEAHQEDVFNKIQAQGYNCKVVAT